MDLLKLSEKFYKLASLKSDMAKRIMYGITQSMTDTVDYPALELTVAGAKDIIKYGADSCFDELKHYKGGTSYGRLQDYGIYKTNKIDENTLPQYILYLELFEEFFNDDKHWNADFGGKAWAKIANTLMIIAQNYLKYLQAPKYSKENLQAANDTIVYINLFDGLAHNTYGVYSSLIEEELKDKGIKTDYKDIDKLMDSKELTDPVDTYDIIKKDLDIDLPYKDYIQKLRQDPEFFKRDPVKVKKEISGVSFVRKIKQDFYNNDNLTEYLQEIKELANFILEICYGLQQIALSSSINKKKEMIASYIKKMFDNDINYFYNNISQIKRDCLLQYKNDGNDFANKIAKELQEINNISQFQTKSKLAIEQQVRIMNVDNAKDVAIEIESLTDYIVDLMENAMGKYKAIRDNV